MSLTDTEPNSEGRCPTCGADLGISGTCYACTLTEELKWGSSFIPVPVHKLVRTMRRQLKTIPKENLPERRAARKIISGIVGEIELLNGRGVAEAVIGEIFDDQVDR